LNYAPLRSKFVITQHIYEQQKVIPQARAGAAVAFIKIAIAVPALSFIISII
jgi:hypothetical protein